MGRLHIGDFGFFLEPFHCTGHRFIEAHGAKHYAVTVRLTQHETLALRL